MGLKAIVKVSSVTNLSDARYCAGMGVEMLGFDINPESQEYIDPVKFQEITGWVAGVKLVGDAHGLSEDAIRSQLVQYELDCLEISDLNLLTSLQNTGVSFIVKVQNADELGEVLALSDNNPSIEYLFLEAKMASYLSQIEDFTSSTAILIGYEVSPEEAKEFSGKGNIKGFVLKGSNEIKPGFKDYDELADILEALDEEG